MKKILCLIAIIGIIGGLKPPTFAINIGTYKSESEYGLLDAFEFNWKKKNRQDGKKFIQLKEDVYRKRTDKDRENDLETEYERTRYMYQGEALI